MPRTEAVRIEATNGPAPRPLRKSPAGALKMGSSASLPAVNDLPEQDNTSEALASLLAANQQYRSVPWPHPFDQTTHRLHLGDARELSWIADESVHLVVTSPPYWTVEIVGPEP